MLESVGGRCPVEDLNTDFECADGLSGVGWPGRGEHHPGPGRCCVHRWADEGNGPVAGLFGLG